MSVSQRGSDFVSSVDPTHPAYEAFVQAGAAFRERLPEHVAEAYERLRRLVAPLDAYDVLAYLQLAAAGPVGVNTALPAGIELAASAVADRPTRRPADAPIVFDLSAIMETLEELQTLRVFSALEQGGRTGEHFDDVRSRAVAMRSAVRGPSYPWQERETLHDLFGPEPIADLLRQSVGCAAEEILRIEETIGTIGGARIGERADAARDFATRLLKELQRVHAGQRAGDRRMREVAERLRNLPRSEATQRAHELAMGWMAHNLGDTLSFTAADIAHDADVDVRACSALLQLLAVRFEPAPRGVRYPDVERFRARPLLVDDAGRYLCVSGHLLLWGLRPALEAALKAMGARAFGVYEHHRKRRVEERAVAALTQALRPGAAEAGLFYDTDDQGPVKRAELDGLLRLDNTLFVVEVKASSMRASARRGAPASMRDWVEREVGHAAAQARRARRALAADQPSALFDAKGRPVTFNLDDVRRAFEVVVTLEDLPAIAPATWQLAEAGVLPTDPIPWVVSLHELETICAFVEWPAQLVHYLMRRRRIDEQRHVWAMEELDFFMHYLSDGLYWERPDGPPTQPSLLASQTDRLDEYLLAHRGLGTRRVRRPRRRMHRDVRALLNALDRLEAPGRLDAQLALLEVDGNVAERIAAGAQRARRSAAAQHRSRDLTFIFEDFGVTVVAVPPDERASLRELLVSYCQLKKHQAKSDAWIGFGAFVGPPEPAQLALILDDPWEPDEDLDKLVAELPTAQSPEPAPAAQGLRWWRDGTWR